MSLFLKTNIKLVLFVLLFLSFSTIYYWGSFSKIPFGDCIGFVFLVEKGEYITTATLNSHLLYVNTAILLKSILNTNAIEASRLLVILSAAITVSLIYITVYDLTKNNKASIVAAIVFGFSFTFWKNAEIVEVYTYNTVWISLFFLCIIKNFLTPHKKYLISSGVLLGISVWLHIGNILLIPAFLLFLYYFRSEKKYVSYSLLLFLIFLALLFIVNYSQGLPIKSPISSDKGSWVEDSFKKSFSQYIQDLIKSFAYLLYNFSIFIFFGIIGIITLYKVNVKMFYIFFVASVCIYGFSTFYAVTDNYVFFLPFNVIFALSIGYGLSLNKYSFLKKTYWLCFLIPFLYYFTLQLVLITPQGKDFNNLKAYKGGLKYYLIPWMNNNVGILEFTIDKKTASEDISWMTASAKEYIHLLKEKSYTIEEIKKF
ncbi:DUF2723 domain-containing protein [Chryseobacterium nematophagum]|uniref:DUF2723 domain-containing protein n=1 Tax=Chryseobacterium nematophagum TaxID=2305228 RepID=A0A3M7L672_9FLAO|nr:DUF2723 domain-containing protein [Chryseobacterium nematophagum]RMZ58087.1 DUF2723 domain-containing protein [Chryseobacterium nematophagum]